MSDSGALAPPRTVGVVHVMGTVVSIELRGDGDHPSALREVEAGLREVDARFSTYRADSEVSRYGSGVLEGSRSPALQEVLAECESLRRRSGGAFDAGFGGRFDPSAFVKGWAVDRAGETLTSFGCTAFSINAGGDVLVSAPAASAAWRIGVQHPMDPGAVALVLQSRGLAVATSARYARGDHLVDPRTGAPARGAVSVTVCGARLGLADAYATAAFVLGEDGPAWVAGIEGYECWSVLEGGRVVATSGFPRTVRGVPVSVGRVTDPSVVAA